MRSPHYKATECIHIDIECSLLMSSYHWTLLSRSLGLPKTTNISKTTKLQLQKMDFSSLLSQEFSYSNWVLNVIWEHICSELNSQCLSRIKLKHWFKKHFDNLIKSPLSQSIYLANIFSNHKWKGCIHFKQFMPLNLQKGNWMWEKLWSVALFLQVYMENPPPAGLEYWSDLWNNKTVCLQIKYFTNQPQNYNIIFCDGWLSENHQTILDVNM